MVTVDAFIVTSGKYKGNKVIKLYNTPKMVMVRNLKPSAFDDLFRYNSSGKVYGSDNSLYSLRLTRKSQLKKIGTIVIPKCFLDADTLNSECGPNGFDLLDKYAGKTKKEMQTLKKSFPPAKNYSECIKMKK